MSRGVYLGGWSDARPKVADSSLAEGRFKFFLGATEWNAGQLDDEFDAGARSSWPSPPPPLPCSQPHADPLCPKPGAWLALDCDPSLVIKDRVLGWRPGRPKPVWTELVRHLGEDGDKLASQIYPDDA